MTILRRPFYLFAHTHTLFAFLAPTSGASRPDLSARTFREHALRSLSEAGISGAAARVIVDDTSDVFCKATDRRVIGTMLDQTHMSRAVLAARSSRTKLRAALAKVPDVAPDPGDELPAARARSTPKRRAKTAG